MSESPSLPQESLGSNYAGDHTADRGYESYVNDLGVGLQPGDRVLDVGAAAGTFAREVWQRSNGTVTVDSLDTFDNEAVLAGRVHFNDSRGESHSHEYWSYNRVVGDVTRGLDLPSESYEHVVSSYAVPTWIDTPEEMFLALAEMMRVCKVGGDIRMFPMYVDNLGNLSGFEDPAILTHVQNVVQRRGHEFRLERVPGDDGTLIENAHRIVIEKKNSGLPTVEDFQRLALIDRLTVALRKFAHS
ncbi:MAG: methyltransferase domain-containing protein [Patescibacteria group bacterium]|nr:methyltransferase domain-containing protein [Patescibacteria group bacterium]